MAQSKDQRERIFGVVDQTNKTLSGFARSFDNPETLAADTALLFIALGDTPEDASKGFHSAIIVGDEDKLRDALVKTIQRTPAFADIIAAALEQWVDQQKEEEKSSKAGASLVAALEELFSGRGGHIIIGGFGKRGSGDDISDEELSGLPPVLQEIIRRARKKSKRG